MIFRTGQTINIKINHQTFTWSSTFIKCCELPVIITKVAHPLIWITGHNGYKTNIDYTKKQFYTITRTKTKTQNLKKQLIAEQWQDTHSK